MKSAKKYGRFPYTKNAICYIEVDAQGKVSQLAHKNPADRGKMIEAYERAVKQAATIYAIWPQDWTSELFVMDDLEAFAEAFGLI